ICASGRRALGTVARRAPLSEQIAPRISPLQGCVTAIHTSTRKIDHRVGAIDLIRPVGERGAVPADHAPRLDLRTPAQHDHVVTVAVKGAGENRPNLSRPARDHDFHPTLRLPLRLEHVLILVNMFTQNVKPRKRGRPPGQTPQGAAAKQRLYEIAIRRMARHGYDTTTLRDVAKEAGVSVGLLYRYFPS